MRGRWPHGPMRPTPPFLGALFRVTVRQISAICGTRVGAGFCDGKRPEAGFTLPQVQNGEPVTELEGGKNGSKHNLMSF